MDHKVVISALSLSSGLTMASMSFSGSLREISRGFERGAVCAACGLTGATLGLTVRLFLS